MFTADERERRRASLVAAVREDGRIVGAAHTGSAALGREDRWSDIDLALSIAADAGMDDVVADWTRRLYEEHGAVAHHDIWYGATRFRVFLLADTLQVDLAFWHDGEFGAIGPSFRLIFGTPAAHPPPAALDPRDLAGVGMAWLYALHVRSALGRGRLQQAENMLSDMREQLLALACVRRGVSPQHARDIDDLPREVTERVAEGPARTTDAAALARAFAVMVEALLHEVEYVDAELARRLTPPLHALAR
ncbi:MAG: nucleotidyltransferase domain-containing protein [Gemmatimonadetes bacterium]|nr:nucleotidyltransferase domain-containing protein [Gemmatimonadota bacterium]